MEIIEEISDKYGLEDPDEFLFMGGDQVTEDRARGCQGARCEEENRKNRLEQLWFKNEDWHFERIAYKVRVVNIYDTVNSRKLEPP